MSSGKFFGTKGIVKITGTRRVHEERSLAWCSRSRKDLLKKEARLERSSYKKWS
jgi:hypothetical protein